MASSISHDLRHYLAAVYANAEFLSEARGSLEERAQMLGEVRLATYGMTDLLDSLLVFSRTGMALRLTREPMGPVVERALALIRAHPQAENVSIEMVPGEQQDQGPVSPDACLDVRKVERAIYNLVLNACQATRGNTGSRIVTVTLTISGDEIALRVADNGSGIPEVVRESLFEPFVSEGKECGTGLGLTVAYRVAQEHGGTVVVESSRPGHTVFLLMLQRGLPAGSNTPPMQEDEHPDFARSGL
jgi:signal transduction histidine kinase